MNPIAKALDEIKFTIPEQVLKEAFKEDRPYWKKAPISLDEMMLTKLIRPRVLVDCNLVGGQMVLVPLEGLSPEYVDNFNLVYHIPKDRTDNKSIISVTSVSYMPYASAYNSGGLGYGSVAPLSMNEVASAAQRVADSVSGAPPISNANATLIAENTVLIKDQFRVTSVYMLRCLLANDEQMNNISPRSYPNFANLCKLAVKSFIYRTLLIKIDQAYLQGGQELGAMKSYVEGLSDAEEMYQTFLNEVWRPTAFMNDQPSYTRYIKLQMSPGV
jgi:hypothetical protein